MPRLILLLAIGLAIWIIYTRIRSKPQAQRKSAWIKVGLGALVFVVVLGVATGRMHWLGAAITGLLSSPVPVRSPPPPLRGPQVRNTASSPRASRFRGQV